MEPSLAKQILVMLLNESFAAEVLLTRSEALLIQVSSSKLNFNTLCSLHRAIVYSQSEVKQCQLLTARIKVPRDKASLLLSFLQFATIYH